MKHYLYLKAILLAFILAFVACGGGGYSGPKPDGGSEPFIAMVSIRGGTFMMGSPTSEPDRDSDETQHRAEVSAFKMSRYQITQAQFERLMGFNPSYFKGANLPVENVTWFDAVAFCNALSDKEGRTKVYTIAGIWKNSRGNITSATIATADWSKNGYRLPTEAEWEYACRAGTTTPFSTGNNITTDQANYDGNYPYDNNAEGIYREKTTSVGTFKPNAWGLYDMHGNVWEWCWDGYGTYPTTREKDYRKDYRGPYETTHKNDYRDPGITNRVIRGGSWGDLGQDLRSAYRGYDHPVSLNAYFGFRVVCP